MKKISSLFIVIIILFISCFSHWSGEDGDNARVTILLGGGAGNRSLAPYPPTDDNGVLVQLKHIVEFSNATERYSFESENGNTVEAVVPSGRYKILVMSLVKDKNDEPYADGSIEIDLRPGQDNVVSIGMYPASLNKKFNWIQENAVDGENYEVIVYRNETIMPIEISFDDGREIEINLISEYEDDIKTIELINNGAMFAIGDGVKFTLKNITLQGRNNTDPLVVVYSDGHLIMEEDSKITGNINNVIKDGTGGVGVFDGGTFTMNGGEISHNKGDQGGGVTVWSPGTSASSFIMNDGKITNNSANANGAGVNVGSYTNGTSTFIMSGNAIIEYNTVEDFVPSEQIIYAGSGGGVHVWNAKFTMSGNAEIRNNSARGAGGVSIPDSTFTMNGGKIHANTARGGRQYTDTGGINNFAGDGGGVGGWAGTLIIEAGEIYSNTAHSGGGVSMGNGNFTMNGGNIYDHTVNGSGGGVSLYNCIFEMTDGNISNNTADGSGGGVYVIGDKMVFTMSGGTIGSSTINGTIINGNTADIGGGVYVGSETVFNINDTAEISGNTADIGGGVFLHGSVFNKTGGIIYGDNGGALSNTATEGPAAVYATTEIIEDYINLVEIKRNKNITTGTGDNLFFNISAATFDDRFSGAWDGDIVKEPVYLPLAQKLQMLRASAPSNNDYTITIDRPESLSPQTLNFGSNINIILRTLQSIDSPQTINLSSNGAMFTIGNSVTLILENITLQGRPNNNNSLVVVNSGGKLVMENGSKITGNGYNGGWNGGGVTVGGGGTFNMEGGEITGNTTNQQGGGVLVYGTFNMYGDAKINDNSAEGGGGVLVIETGVFNMSGYAEIFDNVSVLNGGGVHLFDGAKFEMSGDAEIYSNTAANGGGVSVHISTFNMKGGEIYGNTAANGGGVWIMSGDNNEQLTTYQKPSKFFISDGTIYGSSESYPYANNATNGATLNINNPYATAQYGTFEDDDWTNLSSTNETIHIVDGVPQ